MTTLNRPNSALVVIDVQVGVVAEAFNRDLVVETIRKAVDEARNAGVPVIWVQHSEPEMPIDSDAWQIVPELKPAVDEPIVRKVYRSSFEATNLEELLAAANVGHLYVCGAESNNCLRHTSHSALERGYDVTLISDAHTTTGWEWNGLVVDAARVIDEQNGNFYSYELPGRTAKAVPLGKVEF